MTRRILHFSLLIMSTVGGLHLVDHILEIPHSDLLLIGIATIVITFAIFSVINSASVSKRRD